MRLVVGNLKLQTFTNIMRANTSRLKALQRLEQPFGTRIFDIALKRHHADIANEVPVVGHVIDKSIHDPKVTSAQMQIGHLKVQELMQRFGLYAIILDTRNVPLGCARDSKRMARSRPTRNIVRLRFGTLLRLFECRLARKGVVAE